MKKNTIDQVYFCGQYIDDEIVSAYYNEVGRLVSPAANTFYNALLDGFISNNVEVSVISYLPDQVYSKIEKTSEGKLKIHVKRRLSARLIRNLRECIDAFCMVKALRKTQGNGVNIALVNILRLSQSIGGLLACRMYGVPAIGIVTDVPGYRVKTHGKNALIHLVTDAIGKAMIRKYDYYILLTESMGELLNLDKCRYVVIEGLYKTEAMAKPTKDTKTNEADFTIMYAGSLHYEYGIMNLVEAVHSMGNERISLAIYGSGDATSEIEDYALKDSRIRYLGSLPHEEIVQRESEASLLVNPRPVTDEYVKYSFPSKIMEYMASGTPVLTTRIPSLPREYYPYVYLIEGNSTEEIAEGIDRALHDHSNEIGARARDFIIDNKGNSAQAKKTLDAIQEYLVSV